MDRMANTPLDVTEAKQRLRTAAARLDYLGPVKRHPLEAAAGAFIAGLLWKRRGKNRLPPGLLSLTAQLLKRL